MTERDFIEMIDCRFPYSRPEALRIAHLACGISSNAAFAVVDEVCRPPRSAVAPLDVRFEVLDLIEAELRHPLTKPILASARTVVQLGEIPVEESVSLLHLIAPHAGEYAALSCASMICDDVDGVADALYQDIARLWEVARKSGV